MATRSSKLPFRRFIRPNTIEPAEGGQKLDVNGRIGVTFLLLGILTTPLYFFDSGGMQISHMLVAGFFFFTIVSVRGSIRFHEGILIALAILIGMREATATFLGKSSISSVLEIAYILFALLTLLLVARSDALLVRPRLTRLAMLGSALVAIGGIYAFGQQGTIDGDQLVRAIGTFNNPNQLAYFSVLMMCLSSMLFLRGVFDRKWLVLLGLLSIYLSTLALSKSGMIATMAGGLFAAHLVLLGRKLSFASFALGAILIAVIVLVFLSGAFDDSAVMQRLSGIGSDSDDSFESRGYYILRDGNWLEVLFGFAYDGVVRIHGLEVHSTLFSYFSKVGIVGGMLFAAFVVTWIVYLMRHFGIIGSMAVIAPVFLYSIAHNGSRFTLFWVLAGVSFAPIFNEARARMKGQGSERATRGSSVPPRPIGAPRPVAAR